MSTNIRISENHALSRSIKNIVKVKWTIQNFSYIKKTYNGRIVSPTFYAPSEDEIQFNIIISTISQFCISSIYAQITNKPSFPEEFFTSLKVCVLNVSPEFSKNYLTGHPQLLGPSIQFGTISANINLSQENGFLQDDELTLDCEITFAWRITDILTTNFNIPDCELSEDFGNLYESGKFSDVTLVVGAHKLPAHKAILAARSDVFAAMFENGFKESHTNEVIITDTDHEILQEMLRFIYTGDAPKLKEKSKYLLAAADKFALSELKAMSEEALFADISIENAVEVLFLADHHNAEQLKVKTIRFLKTNFEKIMETDGWQNMKTTHECFMAVIFNALVTLT